MDEYIKREEAIEAAKHAWAKGLEPSQYIEIIPSADVAPVRHGRWGVEVGMNFFKERNCSVCKKRIESNFWNYCPNCGSKMYGDSKEGSDNG